MALRYWRSLHRGTMLRLNNLLTRNLQLHDAPATHLGKGYEALKLERYEEAAQ